MPRMDNYTSAEAAGEDRIDSFDASMHSLSE